MAKTLCEWTRKEIEKDFQKLCCITANRRYLCKKCARGATVAKVLCKPVRALPDDPAEDDE